MKILVVADNDTLRDFLAQFLGQKHKVTTKANGIQAMDWLQLGDLPNLIISDLEMPLMNGYGLISKLQSMESFLDIPIIVLSHKDSCADRIKCLMLGANDYMVKPFDPDELSLRIDHALGNTVVV